MTTEWTDLQTIGSAFPTVVQSSSPGKPATHRKRDPTCPRIPVRGSSAGRAPGHGRLEPNPVPFQLRLSGTPDGRTGSTMVRDQVNSETLSQACSPPCSLLEVVLTHRLHLGWRGQNAAELRADAKAGGILAEK